jgi:hypothetical protein
MGHDPQVAGSEFPAAVIPLAAQHYMLLQRNLIYTGITRGKRLLVLIGQKKALGIAVRNDRPQRRSLGYSPLCEADADPATGLTNSRAVWCSRVVKRIFVLRSRLVAPRTTKEVRNEPPDQFTESADNYARKTDWRTRSKQQTA